MVVKHAFGVPALYIQERGRDKGEPVFGLGRAQAVHANRGRAEECDLNLRDSDESP